MKHMLFTKFWASLYGNSSSKMTDKLEAIYATHTCLVNDSLGGFWFKGQRWFQTSQTTGSNTKQLHESLHPTMLEYIKSLNELQSEENYVRAFLQAALTACTNPGYLYHILPDTLHGVLTHAHFEPVPCPPEIKEGVLKYNQKGYDLLTTRVLRNIIEA